VLLLGSAGQAFDLQGHRGARGLHPENTLEWFRATLGIGVTTLEMDTGVTADGVVVVHHDEKLNPDIARGRDGAWLTPPTPPIHSLARDALGAYDVGSLRPGSAYAQRFSAQRGRDGVRVPTLAAVLADAEAIAGGRIRYNIETKLDPGRLGLTLAPDAFAEHLLRVLREAGVERRASVQSFDWRTLRYLEERAPQVECACLTTEEPDHDTIRRGQPGPSPWTAGLDVDDFGGSVPRLVQAAGCRIWSPNFQDLDARGLAAAHALGIRVIPWTVNERADIDAMLALGTDGIISDYPNRVREALAARGRPLPTRYPRAGTP